MPVAQGRPEALVLSPLFPYPDNVGGKIRTLWTTRFLAQRFTVDFLCFYKREEELEGLPRLLEFCRDVRSLPVPERAVRSRWRAVLGNVLRALPDFCLDFASPEFRDTLDELLATRHYRLIVCEHTDMAQYCHSPRAAPDPGLALPPRSVLVAHNVETAKAIRRVSSSEGSGRRAYACWELVRTFLYERGAARRFDLLVACSDVDEGRLKRWYGVSKTAVLPNGVDCRYFARRPRAAGKDIVLMGTLGYPPNQEAARLFLEVILPGIRRRGLRSQVQILGGAPSAELERLASRDGAVTFRGLVPDVRPYLERAAALAVPLQVGGGTRLKVLTAMAMGTPVVSTSVGVEGLGIVPGREALVADDPAEFAGALASILSEPSHRWTAMVQRARELAERYDWPILGQRLLEAYGKLLD